MGAYHVLDLKNMIREVFLFISVAAANLACECDCPLPVPPQTECSSSMLLALDGSSQNGPFWSSIVVEAKAIVKGYEKIKGVNFGYGDGKTKVALAQYPNPAQHPNVAFDLYNAEDMGSFTSRDVRSLLWSYITATSPSNSKIDVADMLIDIHSKIETESAPKIVVVLTNGFTAQPEKFDQIVDTMHAMDLHIIPIAVSRKCRGNADNVKTHEGYDCPNFDNLAKISTLNSGEVFSIGGSQVPLILQTLKSLQCSTSVVEREVCTCSCPIETVEGPSGQPGSVGPQGDQGRPGLQGPVGEPGLDGMEGEMGAPGQPGVIGEPGQPGNKGRMGSIGEMGVKGAAGEIGIPGRPGNHGQDGASGPMGLPGMKGGVGANGMPGKKGARGANGAAGEMGMPGVGVDGADGVQGPAGEPGVNGEPGMDGYNGLDGIPGEPGKDGERGQAGPHGEPGRDGVDGASSIITTLDELKNALMNDVGLEQLIESIVEEKIRQRQQRYPMNPPQHDEPADTEWSKEPRVSSSSSSSEIDVELDNDDEFNRNSVPDIRLEPEIRDITEAETTTSTTTSTTELTTTTTTTTEEPKTTTTTTEEPTTTTTTTSTTTTTTTTTTLFAGNLALNRPVTSSRGHRNIYDANLVDGKRCNFDGIHTLRCCSRSGFVWQPWFSIELDNTYNVKQVNLKTFTEEAYRLKGAEIRVGHSPDGVDNDLCTIIEKPKENVLQTFSCAEGVSGKYVSIHVPNKYEVIILCEFEVFQMVTDELQDDMSSSSDSSSAFGSSFPLAPPFDSASESNFFDYKSSDSSDSQSSDESMSKSFDTFDDKEDSGDGWFDDEELRSDMDGFLKRS